MSSSFYSLFHSLPWIAACGLLAAALALVCAFRVKGGLVRLTLLALVLLGFAPTGLVVAAMHPELWDARYRAYKAFYRDIELGMSREQVLALMEQHYPATGPRRLPKLWEDTPTELDFFMSAEGQNEPNCEGILLTLENGRVCRRRYSAD